MNGSMYLRALIRIVVVLAATLGTVTGLPSSVSGQVSPTPCPPPVFILATAPPDPIPCQQDGTVKFTETLFKSVGSRW